MGYVATYVDNVVICFVGKMVLNSRKTEDIYLMRYNAVSSAVLAQKMVLLVTTVVRISNLQSLKMLGNLNPRIMTELYFLFKQSL
jgi:hypothetical protein